VTRERGSTDGKDATLVVECLLGARFFGKGITIEMEITERIRSFLTTNFYIADAGDLGSDASLLGRGIVDSTGILEVVAFLESEFGVNVADEEMLPSNLDSIDNIAAFIRRKTAKTA
jgi:acyl carrier protein